MNERKKERKEENSDRLKVLDPWNNEVSCPKILNHFPRVMQHLDAHIVVRNEHDDLHNASR